MTVAARRERIVELVRQAGYLPIEALVQQCRVTPQTIRVDLNALAEQGALVRHHGGAAMPSSVTNTDYETRRGEHSDAKAKLAQAVQAMVPDRSSVFLSLGTTMLAVARALRQRKGLKIITHHLEAAQLLARQPDFEVVVLGGHLDARNFGITGPQTQAMLAQYRPDFCLFSAGALDAQGQVLEYHESEAALVQLALARARNRILVVDHSKLTRSAAVLLTTVDSLDAVVSDSAPPPALKRILREHGVRWMRHT